MTEKMIVDYCAPTLAGLKTGSLFMVNEGIGTRIIQELCSLNRLLRRYGLTAVCLKQTVKNTMVYIYRNCDLLRDLQKPKAQAILAEQGYPSCSLEQYVAMLSRRVRYNDDFPHEIGLFLGYPPDDVKAFMEHPCSGVKCVGCWKAYSNPEQAQKTFDRYDACTDYCRRQLNRGISLERLLVARMA
ncbi:MAG: DUF3793 family protein [Solobacterium sp.]|nr:DUF3793 family protein [Solobacterium sp.]